LGWFSAILQQLLLENERLLTVMVGVYLSPCLDFDGCSDVLVCVWSPVQEALQLSASQRKAALAARDKLLSHMADILRERRTLVSVLQVENHRS
jgi:hypothetical protein